MTWSKMAAAALATGALLSAAQAHAHARLVGSTPAEGAAVAAPKQVVLKFSEKLQPKFSTARLSTPTSQDLPAKAVVEKDGATLVVTPAAALAPGAYIVHWQAVSADTHRMEGQLSFTVR